jgi:hypothetical protein
VDVEARYTLLSMRDGLQNLGRREVIQRLAMSIGGVLTFPLVASAHPIQHHLRDASTIAIADASAAAEDYTPAFLDSHQIDTLAMLAERIVPGSTQAKSAPFIDQLLAVATPDDQRTFLQAMGAFEGLAISRYHAPWKQLTDEQQTELLTMASTAKPGAAPKPSEPADVTIRDRFDHVKGWIVGAYYSSEIGMRELGWTGSMFFATLPGCDHPDGHR